MTKEKTPRFWRRLASPGRRAATAGVAGAVALGLGLSAWAVIVDRNDLATVRAVEGTALSELGGHMSQFQLSRLVAAGRGQEAFVDAFEHGDELFALSFNAGDGGGANVGGGLRYTRMPRADLTGAGQWATHQPNRATGPNASACTGCHIQAAEDGSGEPAANVHRDEKHTGQAGQMVTRNTPHLFGMGGIQRLAEEMTVELHALRDQARRTCNCGEATAPCNATADLRAKGIDFGRLTLARAAGTSGCTETVAPPAGAMVAPIANDLVVRAFQWKGSVVSIRDFVRGAAHNELGMQGVELLGSPSVNPARVDGDGDGVSNELSVGDITALTVYMSSQARPTTRQELAALRIIPALSARENSDIAAGSRLFDQIGCNRCHVRQLTIDTPIFSEPSTVAAFRDPGDRFPNGRTYLSDSLDPARAVKFDLTRDVQENADIESNGQPLGTFRRAGNRAVVELFGDLRRHDLGAGLAESVDEQGTGPSVFLTENLWGVGSSAPYMHDGRATTLTEAILEHGGEGQASRTAFRMLSVGQRQQLVAFLKNLVIFKASDEEE